MSGRLSVCMSASLNARACTHVNAHTLTLGCACKRLLLLAAAHNSRVQVLRYCDGAHIRSIGSYGSGAGQLQHPCDVAIDDDGRIVVGDSYNHRVQVLPRAPQLPTIACTRAGGGRSLIKMQIVRCATRAERACVRACVRSKSERVYACSLDVIIIIIIIIIIIVIIIIIIICLICVIPNLQLAIRIIICIGNSTPIGITDQNIPEWGT